MTARIPPITTPVIGESDDIDQRSINSLWYRFLLQLQEASGVPEAPKNGQIYGRINGAWQVTLSDAPDDGFFYVRNNGAWYALTPFSTLVDGLVPAPKVVTGKKFLRDDGQWIEVSSDKFNFVGGVIVTACDALPSGGFVGKAPPWKLINYV